MKALGQNATDLAVSPTQEQDYDFAACVKRNAERTAKGTTRERHELRYNKLISACCADYRSHYPMIYGKTERLPTDIHSKIEEAVTNFVQNQLNRVNVTNVVNFRRGFHHNEREMEITDRITTVGENKLTLQEQLLGVNIYINSANKRLDDLMKKPTPDYERERMVKQSIMRLEITKQFILGEINTQEKLKKEAEAKS
jgi:hypothetical protein